MTLIGPDFRAGLRQALYRPFNPVGLRAAIAIFIALVVTGQVLPAVFGFGTHAVLSGGDGGQGTILRNLMLGLLPAGLLTAALAWALARIRSGAPARVLALQAPQFGIAGWAAIVGGFLISLYALLGLAVYLFSIDTANTGIVEQAMDGLASDPLYPLIAAGVAIGAPLAEEVTFRGQIFAALSLTRLGYSGTALLTSAAWALLHITEPLHAVGFIFLMGLVLSFLLIRFGSLWVTIVCHALWNGAYALLILAMPPT